MPQAPILTDGTVTLRAHRPDDVQRCWEQCQDPLSRQWTTVPIPYSHADAVEFVAGMPQRWETGSSWIFAVEYAGRYCATVELRDEGSARAEVAYGSHPDVRGTGVMERALRLLLAWGFEEKGLRTVIWWANVGNWASRKLAWRLGFSFDGTVRQWLPHRGELRDGWVGTLLRGAPTEPDTPWVGPAELPLLTGERVVLRPLRDDDVPRIAEACSDPQVQRFFGAFPEEFREEQARDLLRRTRSRGPELRRWAVADRSTDVFLGVVSIFDLRPGTEDGEIGYWLHPDARGRGIATEATRLVAAYAFDGLGLLKLKAATGTDNTASQRVLEKLGMTAWGIERLGTRLRSGPADAVWYDVTREEWAAR